MSLARPHTTEGPTGRKAAQEPASRPDNKSLSNNNRVTAERIPKQANIKQPSLIGQDSEIHESSGLELKLGGNLSNDDDVDKRREIPPLPSFRVKAQQTQVAGPSSRMSIAGVKRPLIREELQVKERVHSESSTQSSGNSFNNPVVSASSVSLNIVPSLNAVTAHDAKRAKRSSVLGATSAWR